MEAGLVHCTPENAMLGHRSEYDFRVRESVSSQSIATALQTKRSAARAVDVSFDDVKEYLWQREIRSFQDFRAVTRPLCSILRAK